MMAKACCRIRGSWRSLGSGPTNSATLRAHGYCSGDIHKLMILFQLLWDGFPRDRESIAVGLTGWSAVASYQKFSHLTRVSTNLVSASHFFAWGTRLQFRANRHPAGGMSLIHGVIRVQTRLLDIGSYLMKDGIGERLRSPVYGSGWKRDLCLLAVDDSVNGLYCFP